MGVNYKGITYNLSGMLIYGVNPVLEALKRPERIEKVLVAEGRRLPAELVELLRASGVRWEVVPRKRLDKLTGGSKHQGVVAVISEVGYESAEALLERLLTNKGFAPLLYDAQDPHNIGAAARTALFLGAEALVLAGHHTPGITPAAVKASAGALLNLPVVRLRNPKGFIKEFKERGGWVLALETGGEDIRRVKFTRPLLLLFGNEGEGLPKKLLEAADWVAEIPGSGLSSLNLSVSVAIALWEVRRRT